MPYKVIVSPEVARLREGGGGSRNVVIGRGTPERRVLTFNRVPTYLSTLPAEVAADTLLIVSEIADDEMARAGGRLADAAAAEDDEGEAEIGGGEEDDEDMEIIGETDQTIVEGDADPDKVNKSNAKPKRRTAKRKH